MGPIQKLFAYITRRRRATRVNHAAATLAAAEGEAAHLVKQAAQQAKLIVGSTRLTSAEAHADFERALHQLKSRATASLEQHLAEVNQTVATQSAAITKQLAAAARTQLAELQHAIAAQSAKLNAQLITDAKSTRQRLQQELDDKRRTSTLRLQAVLVKELPGIVKEVVGRSLTLTDHEQLVREALEKARRQELWQPPT